MNRGLLLLAGACAVLAAGCSRDEEDAAPAPAAPAATAPASPPPRAEAAPFARRQVGEAQITTVTDGRGEFQLDLFQGVEPAETDRLLRAGGAASPPVFPVQGFVVDVGGRRTLIDAGAGATIPTAGRLGDNLAAADIAPGSIQAVLISHLHGDHVGGIVDDQGRPRFPNATIHVHADEAAFWTDEKRAAAAPEAMRPYFDTARNALKAYGDKVKTFKSGEVVPGITAEPLPGHTPGHTIYRLATGAQEVLFLGDMIHSLAIQMPRPDVTLQFDNDADAARKARLGFLQRTAGQNVLVAGPHFAFPGIGRIEKAGTAYRFTAADAAAAPAAAAPAR